MQSHEPKVYFRCRHCSETFIHHRRGEEHEVICERIQQQDTLYSFSNGVYTCKICGKSWLYLSYFKKHEKKHTGEKPFQCAKCLKSFAHSSNCNRHQKKCEADNSIVNQTV